MQNRSSTSSFSILRLILAVDASFLCCLLVFIVTSSFVAYHGRWLHIHSSQSRIAKVIRYVNSRANTPPEIIFMGSSRFESAINPNEFAKSIGLSSYRVLNLAQENMGPWEALVILRNTKGISDKARHVVLEIDPMMFNSNAIHPITKKKAPDYPAEFDVWADFGERRHVGSRLGRWKLLVEYLPFLNEKRNVREWVETIRTACTGTSRVETLETMPYFGDKKKEFSLAHDPDFKAENISQCHLHDFEFSTEKSTLFTSLLAYLEERNIDIILVHPPVRKEYYSYVLDNQNMLMEYRKYIAFVEKLRMKHKSILWLTPSDGGLNDSVLMDYGHFTYAGSLEFSRRLAEEMHNRHYL